MTETIVVTVLAIYVLIAVLSSTIITAARNEDSSSHTIRIAVLITRLSLCWPTTLIKTLLTAHRERKELE